MCETEAMVSASTWDSVAATVTGEIAPPRMKGDTTTHCPARAYSFKAKSIVRHMTKGALVLTRISHT